MLILIHLLYIYVYMLRYICIYMYVSIYLFLSSPNMMWYHKNEYKYEKVLECMYIMMRLLPSPSKKLFNASLFACIMLC